MATERAGLMSIVGGPRVHRRMAFDPGVVRLDTTQACRTVILPTGEGVRRLPNLTALLAMLLVRFGVPVLLHGVAAGATGRDMVAWTKEPRVLRACPIGKFRDKPWPEVDAGFLRWMLDQPSMEADYKWNAQRELDRRAAA